MAAGQYRKIEEFEKVLYNPNSPVTVEKMVLQHDLIYDVNVLQITFRNVDILSMYGLGIVVTLKDEEGKKMYNDIEFNYYGIEVASGRTFGGNEDIVVEPDVAKYEITVVRADLAEGKRFHGKTVLTPAPTVKPIESLEEFAEGFKNRVLKIRPKAKVVAAFDSEENHWYCTCGKIYPRNIKQCPICKLKHDDLIAILPELKEEKRLQDIEDAKRRKEEEELEQLRQEEEERKRQAEERERLRQEAEEKERIRIQEERINREHEALRQQILKKQKRIKRIAIWASSLVCVAVLSLIFVPKVMDYAAQQKAQQQGIGIGEATSTDYEYNADVQSTTDEGDKLATGTDGYPVTTVALLAEGLDETETKTIWRLFGKTETALEHDTVYMTTEKQRAYMLDMLGKRKLEDRALSCVLIQPTEEGTGLKLKLYNITKCTEEDFKTVLTKLGVKDASVIIAAPQKASGSTALASLYSELNKNRTVEGKPIGIATSYSRMNIRTGPSTSYESYGLTEPKTQVQVVEILDNGWLKIIWNDSMSGYAYTCYNDGNAKYYMFENN